MVSLNLHINYDCPLKCRYCVQRNDPNLLKQFMTLEDMIERVEHFMNFCQVDVCNVNISGGEPLLRYSDIQVLMQHFPQNQWEISTSGYLLDEEKAKWFSQFNTRYILSIDGTKKVTNYLRPLANGKLGYFDQLRKNIPHILYYNPWTRAKLIVPKRFIDQIFPTYLELERLGFHEIFITPNVYENTVDTHHPELETGRWLPDDWISFATQLDLINNEIIKGLEVNRQRCLISNVKHTMAKLCATALPNSNDTLNVKKMICPVLEFKGGSSPIKGQIGFDLLPISLCMWSTPRGFISQSELQERAKKDFAQLNWICPKDPKCKFQKSCVYEICLSESCKSMANDNIWIPSDFACYTQKIYHLAALYLLQALLSYNNETATQYWDKIQHILEEVE